MARVNRCDLSYFRRRDTDLSVHAGFRSPPANRESYKFAW